MFGRHEYDAKKTLDSRRRMALNDLVMMVAAQREFAVPGLGTRSDRAQPGERLRNAARRLSADRGRAIGWRGDQ